MLWLLRTFSCVLDWGLTSGACAMKPALNLRSTNRYEILSQHNSSSRLQCVC